MLDGVFHDRLEGQWWKAKIGNRRIEFRNKHITKLRLLYGQIGMGVLQFRGKENGAVAGNGIEIPAQIAGEIQRDLPGLWGIELA